MRYLRRVVDRYAYIARFDVVSYYESIDHALLLGLLNGASIGADLCRIVTDYLALPDRADRGKGLVAGFKCKPDTIRRDTGRRKGYYTDKLQTAIQRYLPDPGMF